MRRRACALLLLTGCPRDLPEDRACAEVGYSIAARLEQCSGDSALAHELYEAFESQTTCTIAQLPEGSPMLSDPTLQYECALVTRNLACELAVEYGADVAPWLDSSRSCHQILEGP